MKHFKKYIPLFIILVLSITAWMLGIQKYLNIETLKENQRTLESYIHDHQIISVFIFIGTYTLLVSLSIPGAFFMTILGGFFFGQALGTTATVISATIGATILFLSARLASKDLLEKKGGHWVKKMQDGFQEDAFSYLITLRLIPLFPFVAINLVASLLQISLVTFFFGTLIGIIPGSFVYTSMGVALHEVINKPDFNLSFVLDRHILIALIGLGFLSLLPILYKRYHKHHKKED